MGESFRTESLGEEKQECGARRRERETSCSDTLCRRCGKKVNMLIIGTGGVNKDLKHMFTLLEIRIFHFVYMVIAWLVLEMYTSCVMCLALQEFCGRRAAADGMQRAPT